MKIREFLMLPKLIKEDDFSIKLKPKSKFLFGERMIEQIETKTTGDEITYYQVLKLSGKNVEYIPRYEILEEDFIDGRRKTN
jgi:hypothetical protein